MDISQICESWRKNPACSADSADYAAVIEANRIKTPTEKYSQRADYAAVIEANPKQKDQIYRIERKSI